MDPTNPVSPEVPLSTPEKKDGHWIAIAAMALFVAASLVAVGFLYYQNQQLKTMLASYQTQASPTPLATIDPTAGWKTYTNTTLGFAFRYPATWKEAIDSSTSIQNGREFRIQTDKGEFINGTVYDKVDSTFIEQAWSKQIKLSGSNVILITYTDNVGPGSNGGIQDIQLFNQVLSTFKFLGPTSVPSATQMACTLEAKICPDGSSVGRTGPNCEFAACP